MRGLDRPLVRFCARRCGRSSVGDSLSVLNMYVFKVYIRTHIIFDNLLLYAVLLC